MDLPLREALLARVPEAFPGERFEVFADCDNVIVFHARHPEVGNITVTADEDGYIVFVGSRSHAHFGYDADSDEPPEQQAEILAHVVVEFLQKIFADQVEIYGGGSGGGMRERRARPRGLLSRLIFGWRTFVWSGPLR